MTEQTFTREQCIKDIKEMGYGQLEDLLSANEVEKGFDISIVAITSEGFKSINHFFTKKEMREIVGNKNYYEYVCQMAKIDSEDDRDSSIMQGSTSLGASFKE